jgi:hypothetical protein
MSGTDRTDHAVEKYGCGSVTNACARIRTAARNPCRRAKASLHKMAAATPQVGGQASAVVVSSDLFPKPKVLLKPQVEGELSGTGASINRNANIGWPRIDIINVVFQKR